MRAADLIIIYFALGSPFGVYAATGSQTPITWRESARLILRFLLWPLAGAAGICRWLIEDAADLETWRRTRIGSLREKLESAVFNGRCSPAVFEFRDMFERYSALTLSLDGDPYSHPLLALKPHTSKAAAACIYRIERERLAFHQERARVEFECFVTAAHKKRPDNGIAHLGGEIARSLNDGRTFAVLTGAVAGDGPKAPAAPVITDHPY